MAISYEENVTLTSVGKGTLVGDMLRGGWHPVLRASRLIADDAPVRVRLLGENFVAFRTSDGSLGFFDEQCPHRGASLALGHNAENGLRCLYHGWRFDARGTLTHIPTEDPADAQRLTRNIRARSFPIREAGSLIWVYIGEGEPPVFPDFEFTALSAEHVDVRVSKTHANWIQTTEICLDSAHLGQLHRSSFPQSLFAKGTPEEQATLASYLKVGSPKFDIEATPYGFRESSRYVLPDGYRFVRFREFVAPYYSLIGTYPRTDGDWTICVTIPHDDEWSSQFFVTFNPHRPLRQSDLEAQWRFAEPNPDDYRGDPGSVDNLWGQNRHAMKAGHTTGFPTHHAFHEDFVIVESMTPIVDRTKENLASTDKVVQYFRRQLLRSALAYREQRGTPWGIPGEQGFSYAGIRAGSVEIPAGEDWSYAYTAKDSVPSAA